MNSLQVRKKFLEFFENKGHKIVPSSSLLPEDSTVLFTSAGMQQFLPHFIGEKDPIKDFGTRHLASCQKCFRTDDIDEVGDQTHHTFFEMLGNWSIGEYPEKGYFKEGAIDYALEFLVEELSLNKDKIWVTIFKGEKEIPKDKESLRLWKNHGIKKEKIKEFGMGENFWGPVGEKIGPCGPSSEIFYDRGKEFGCQKKDCGPNCPNCNRFFELWNLVFMGYNKLDDGSFQKLPQRNIDTGIGFERLVAVLQNKKSAYETDLFRPIYEKIEFSTTKPQYLDPKLLRKLSDHIRASAFLISEGILPSKEDRGYVLRKLLRRCVRYAQRLVLREKWYTETVKAVVKIYSGTYPSLRNVEEKIITVIQNEEESFDKALRNGLKQLNKIFHWVQENKDKMDELDLAKAYGRKLASTYETFAFPIGFSLEEFDKYLLGKEWPLRNLSKEDFKKEAKRSAAEQEKAHQEISRLGSERKFGGGGKFSPKLHTATHLLHSALRVILGEEVQQMGSDITKDRLRLDFSFSRQLTQPEIDKIESLVNQKIKVGFKIKMEEVPLKKALSSGALAFFKEKYPAKVKVYTILDPKTGKVFSKEICAGPHIEVASELGQFKIQKEESIGRNIRRIRATLG